YLGLLGDEVAVVGECANERIDLPERDRRSGYLALEVPTQRAVVDDADLQEHSACVVDGRGAVLLDQVHDALDAARAGLALAAPERVAKRTDVRAGEAGGGQQLAHPRVRVLRLVTWKGAAPAALLGEILAEKLAALVQEAHASAVPLDVDHATDPAGRRVVVRGIDLDTAVEVHDAAAVLVIAKSLERKRLQVRPFLGKHRRDLALGGAVDARVSPALLPAVEVRLCVGEALEAKSLERRVLRVADAALDFAFAVSVAHTARQRDGAMVGEHVAVKRIESRVVDVGLEHALLEVVEHDDTRYAAEAAEGGLVELGPDSAARAKGEQADRLAAIAERQDEETRAAVLAGLRVAHHRPVAIVDLRLLARRSLDDRALLG